MFSEAKITEIYCMAYDFCKEFDKVQGKYMVKDKKHKHRNKPNRMNDADRILLKKRILIETVNDELKGIAQIEHSRHRSFNNFIANSLSAIAYTASLKKRPDIGICFAKERQLTLF